MDQKRPVVFFHQNGAFVLDGFFQGNEVIVLMGLHDLQNFFQVQDIRLRRIVEEMCIRDSAAGCSEINAVRKTLCFHALGIVVEWKKAE